MNIIKEFYKFPLFWMGIAMAIALINFFILPPKSINLFTAICQCLIACFFLHRHKTGFTVNLRESLDLILSLFMTLAFIATVIQASNLYT